jgi:hypothetical protein
MISIACSRLTPIARQLPTTPLGPPSIVGRVTDVFEGGIYQRTPDAPYIRSRRQAIWRSGGCVFLLAPGRLQASELWSGYEIT